MTVLDIIREYLTINGYDGLYCDLPSNDECACLLDDLAPCEGDGLLCKPGIRSDCDCEDGACRYHVGAKEE